MKCNHDWEYCNTYLQHRWCKTCDRTEFWVTHKKCYELM